MAPDSATAGLPASMPFIRFAAAFGLDRREALRVLDGHIQSGGRVNTSDGVEALRSAGLNPVALRDEIDLSNPLSGLSLLVAEQVRRRMPPAQVQAQSGVAESSVRGWLAGQSSPTLGKLVAYARAIGFDVILKQEYGMHAELNLSDQRAAIGGLFAERTRVGLSVWDLEAKSGVSAKSMYAWRAGKRAPGLDNVTALAQTLGFGIILRRRPSLV